MVMCLKSTPAISIKLFTRPDGCHKHELFYVTTREEWHWPLKYLYKYGYCENVFFMATQKGADNDELYFFHLRGEHYI